MTSHRLSGFALLLLSAPFFISCSDPSASSDGSTCPARKAGQAQDKVEKYVPADNEVAGWVEDPAVGAAGVEAGYTYDEIVAIIDGSQEPYAAAGCKGFAKQDYKKGTFTFTLEIWEMKDTATAKSMFDTDKANLANDGIANSESIPCVYDASVIGNDSQMWKGYFYKSQYITKFVSRCATTGDVPALKTEAIALVKDVADKLP